MRKIERWIDLSDLPVWGKSGKAKKGTINWKDSIGCKCKFKYDDIKGEVEIVDYTSKGQKLTIKYLYYDLFEINTGNFIKCQLGKLLKKKTDEFKVKIGQTFKDDKRDLIVIDRKYRIKKRKDGSISKYKWYKYHCNKCNNKDWIVEYHLLKGNGCNVCCNRITKLGINTIYNTDKWMIDLGVSEKDAKKYTSQSNKKIKVKCPNCEKEKYMSINHIYRRKSIGCLCGDGVSYPEKFVISLLDQLNINYIKEYSPEWIKPKRYDFYFELDNKKYIIETHGEQHYNGKFNTTKEEQQENDQYKKELALNNGINYYIELDCRESKLNYIKNSIINSKLNSIFNLNNINWLECERFGLSNRVKEVCDYWKLHNEINNEGLTTTDIGEIFKLCQGSICRFLNKGTKLGWCNYNGKEEVKNGSKKRTTKVEIFRDGNSLGIFESCRELKNKSEELFGIKLNESHISAVARGERKSHRGFTFKYIENQE